MIRFIVWVTWIGTGIALLVFATLIVLLLVDFVRAGYRRVVLPPPDRAAERMYDQQYFDRAVGKKVE